MTTEEVEELLRSTREEYSQQGQTTASPPSPVSQPAPQAVSTEKTSGSFSGPPVSGIFLAVLFTILLIALGVALSLQHGWFQQRGAQPKVAKVDTVQQMLKHAAEQASTPPEKPTQEPEDSIPPEALAVPHDEPPVKPKPVPSARNPHSKPISHPSAKPALATSSNFEAEERLAEMRADGNEKAHIKTIHKGGSVKYEVIAK